MGNQGSVAYMTLDQLNAAVCGQLGSPLQNYSKTNVTNITLPSPTDDTKIASGESVDYAYNSNLTVDDIDPDVSLYRWISNILYSRISVAVCVLGLIGNIFNLLILIPRGLYCSLGRVEQFAYTGLVALAVADILFCLVIIPHGFLDLESTIFDKLTFTLIYHTYSNAVINMVLLCSTWLTVTLAIGRYIAVCYPIQARDLFSKTFTKWSLFGVVSCCILFNLPRFWEFYVAQIKCDDHGDVMYFTYYGYMKENIVAYNIYMWIYFNFAIFIPFLSLIFCNCHLALALHRSQKMRLPRGVGNATESSNLMTTMLAIVVMMYLLLVTPAEIINFIRHRFIRDTEKINLVVAAVNTLQAINFSVNFVLYYVINKSFRKSFINLVTCRWRRWRWSSMRHRSSYYASVTSVRHARQSRI